MTVGSSLFNRSQAAGIAVAEYSDLYQEVTSSFVNSASSYNMAVSNMQQSEGTTFTATSVRRFTQFFADKARPSGQPDIMVIITDGRTSPSDSVNLDAAVTELQANGITTIVVGLGRNVDDAELLQLAQNEQSRVFRASFDELANELEMYLNAIEDVCRSLLSVCTTTQSTTPSTSQSTTVFECFLQREVDAGKVRPALLN